MEAWPPSGYQYRIHQTFLHPPRIILAHESDTRNPVPTQAVIYERRLLKKFPPRSYEFHLKNGIILAGNTFMKNDTPNPTRPFIAIKNFRMGFHRPDDPKSGNPDKETFAPFSDFDYILLNTSWIDHFHRLEPYERSLWFPLEDKAPFSA